MLGFHYKEDQEFFEKILLHDNFHDIIDFKEMFDFRNPDIKRKEFNKIRNQKLEILKVKHGLKCMLNFGCCDFESGIAVDHLIPLSTNKLNKELRNMKAIKGKKVKTQSYGSNHLDNLIIACSNCNNHKKHRILDRENIISILREKRTISSKL